MIDTTKHMYIIGFLVYCMVAMFSALITVAVIINLDESIVMAPFLIIFLYIGIIGAIEAYQELT